MKILKCTSLFKKELPTQIIGARKILGRFGEGSWKIPGTK